MRANIRNLTWRGCRLGSLGSDQIHSFIVWLAVAIAVLGAAASIDAQSSDSLVQCWSYREPISVTGGVLIDESNVYAVASGDRVISLDRMNGAVVWTSEPGGSVTSPIRAVNSSIIFVSKTTAPNGRPAASYVRAISKATGITNWVTPLSQTAIYSLAGSEKSIFAVAQAGPLVALDPANGTVRWSRDGSGFANKETYFGGDRVARFSGAKAVEVISLDSWKTIGRFELGFVPKVITTSPDRTLVAGDERGNLESISLDSFSRNWSYKAGGAISHLLIREGNVIATSADNFVYSISLSSGNVEWKRRMPGRINSIALLTDMNLGLTVVGEKTGYILDLSDGRFSGRVALGGDEEFAGHSLVGDGRFVVAITNQGLTVFSTSCSALKAAGSPAA